MPSTKLFTRNGLLCCMCDLHNTLHIIEFIIHDGLKAIGYLDVKIKFAKRLAAEGNGSLDETLAEDICIWESEKTRSLKGMHDMVVRESGQYTSRWTPVSPLLSPTLTPGSPKKD